MAWILKENKKIFPKVTAIVCYGCLGWQGHGPKLAHLIPFEILERGEKGLQTLWNGHTIKGNVIIERKAENWEIW